MKNKVRLIDVNMLSMYMGRWATIISILFVVTLTLSALYGSRRGQHNIIALCVPSTMPPQAAECLRVLLGRETRRPVDVYSGSTLPDECDVYVLNTSDYLRHRARLDLEPLFEVLDTDRRTDQAVLFARNSDAFELSGLEVGEIAFSSPTSVNGSGCRLRSSRIRVWTWQPGRNTSWAVAGTRRAWCLP